MGIPITINGLNINDNVNYLVEEVTYRQVPKRQVYSEPISRRPGNKLTGAEWDNKEIEIKGYVFATTASGLRGNVDILHQNAAVQGLAMAIDSDRTYTATLEKLDIPTQFFNNTYVNFDAMFLCVDPFAYGPLLTASGVTTSGTVTYSGSLTISGTVFASPTLTINPLGALVGDSGLKSIKITHTPSGETMTVSGMINYLSDLSIDYKNLIVTNSGVSNDYTGVYSRFGPGVVNYTITVISGAKQGYDWKWTYQPRYFQ